MRGSLGYIVEEHPLAIVIGATVLLIAVWYVLRPR
jgi:hypothetical protein